MHRYALKWYPQEECWIRFVSIKRIASFFLSNIKCLSKAILSCVLVPAISFDDIEYIKKTEKNLTKKSTWKFGGWITARVRCMLKVWKKSQVIFVSFPTLLNPIDIDSPSRTRALGQPAGPFYESLFVCLPQYISRK